VRFIISNNGWTLIELVLVIALVALISTAVLPKAFDTSAFRKKIQEEETLFALRYLQKRAIVYQCELRLDLDNKNIISVMKPCDEQIVDFSNNFTNLKTALTFHPNGSISANNNASIIKLDKPFNMIKIISQTGLIYVAE
jgi:prepilin-type N-terminal cleavage/methylation domain-containing protein